MFFGVSAALLGCRTECAVDGPEPAEAQYAREEKAVYRGQPICRELLTPRLAVTGDHVVLSAVHENVIAARSDLPASEVKRVEPLFVRLKSYRTHFKRMRGADGFDATLSVTVDPKLEEARLASLLLSAAQAGYPRSQLYVEARHVEVQWWQPAKTVAQIRALCIDPRAGGKVSVRVGDDRAPREAATVTSLSTEINTACAGLDRCADVVAIGAAPLARTAVDAIVLLEAIYQATPFALARPPVVIGGDGAICPPPRDEQLTPSGARAPTRPP